VMSDCKRNHRLTSISDDSSLTNTVVLAIFVCFRMDSTSRCKLPSRLKLNMPIPMLFEMAYVSLSTACWYNSGALPPRRPTILPGVLIRLCLSRRTLWRCFCCAGECGPGLIPARFNDAGVLTGPGVRCCCLIRRLGVGRFWGLVGFPSSFSTRTTRKNLGVYFVINQSDRTTRPNRGTCTVLLSGPTSWTA
jgi:hypothetical protein